MLTHFFEEFGKQLIHLIPILISLDDFLICCKFQLKFLNISVCSLQFFIYNPSFNLLLDKSVIEIFESVIIILSAPIFIDHHMTFEETGYISLECLETLFKLVTNSSFFLHQLKSFNDLLKCQYIIEWTKIIFVGKEMLGDDSTMIMDVFLRRFVLVCALGRSHLLNSI